MPTEQTPDLYTERSLAVQRYLDWLHKCEANLDPDRPLAFWTPSNGYAVMNGMALHSAMNL